MPLLSIHLLRLLLSWCFSCLCDTRSLSLLHHSPVLLWVCFSFLFPTHKWLLLCRRQCLLWHLSGHTQGNSDARGRRQETSKNSNERCHSDNDASVCRFWEHRQINYGTSWATVQPIVPAFSLSASCNVFSFLLLSLVSSLRLSLSFFLSSLLATRVASSSSSFCKLISAQSLLQCKLSFSRCSSSQGDNITHCKFIFSSVDNASACERWRAMHSAHTHTQREHTYTAQWTLPDACRLSLQVTRVDLSHWPSGEEWPRTSKSDLRKRQTVTRQVQVKIHFHLSFSSITAATDADAAVATALAQCKVTWKKRRNKARKKEESFPFHRRGK